MIIVKCSNCGNEYEDWYRGSINLDIDNFDNEYVEKATTTICYKCKNKELLGSVIIKDNDWKLK